MSVYAGPEIPNGGLVLSIDMVNTDKSFKGRQTTNIFWHPTPDAAGNVNFQYQGIFPMSLVTGGNYGGYDIKSSDKVYRMNFTTDNGCYYFGNRYDGSAGALVAGQVYTFSYDYYISPNTTGYPQFNFLSNIEIYDTTSPSWTAIGGAAYADPSPSIIGVWKRASFSATVPSGATVGLVMQYYLYPGACNPSRLANTGFILYKNPQMELSSFGSPFVANTRSNTQTVIDITGLNTVTANSLTFNSNNTFSFNGTNSSITIPFNSSSFTFNTEQTISIWLRPTDLSARRNPYAQAYGGGGTITQELDGMFTYYHGSAGVDGLPYQGSGSGFAITANETAMITVVRNASDVRFYKNAVLGGVTTNGFSANTVTGTSSLRIGSGYVSNYQGNIFKVDVYNRALSAQEVKQNFYANRGRFGI